MSRGSKTDSNLIYPSAVDRVARRRGFSALALALLAATVVAGYLVHRDYGVSWDEPTQHGYGRNVVANALKGGGNASDDALKAYGPAYEVALVAAEFVSGVRDTADIFALRHLLNFLTFTVGLVFFFRFGALFLHSRPASLAACAALVVSPVIFGHAFFNSKDLPFLTFFVVAMYSLACFLDRPRLTTALVHGLASGWLIAIRVPGLLIVALTVSAAIWMAIRASAEPRRSRPLAWVGPYFVVTAACTVLFWPSLWAHPWTNFWHAVQTMSRYPWPGEVMYAGVQLPATSLPWHYVLTWIAITTPLVYLVGFAAGLPTVVGGAWRELRGPGSPDGIRAWLVLAWFFVPLGSVIAFQSVLYDGWRHLFFVYPALLLIAAKGYLVAGVAFRQRWTQLGFRLAAIGACLLVVGNIVAVVAFMIRAHPFEYVYFNALAGGPRSARFRFDMDYWGLAYRRGLEAILRTDQDPVIPVYAFEGPAEENALGLPFADRHRLLFVTSMDQAKYFVGGYRLRRDEYPFHDVLDRVDVDGAPILLVAVLDRRISLTEATAPAVTEVRARNEASMSGLESGAIRARVDAALRTWLARFVRNPRVLEIDVGGETENLRQGRIAQVRIRILDAEIGDFRRNRPGIPLRVLDITVNDLVIDVARPLASVRPALIQHLTIGEFTLEEKGLNDALARMGRTLNLLRVHFRDEAVRIEYLGRPAAEVMMRLRIGPDPWKSRGDNLWFTNERIRLAGWRVPFAWLLNVALAEYSPAIAPDQIDATISLGSIQIRDGVFRLGTVTDPARDGAGR